MTKKRRTSSGGARKLAEDFFILSNSAAAAAKSTRRRQRHTMRKWKGRGHASKQPGAWTAKLIKPARRKTNTRHTIASQGLGILGRRGRAARRLPPARFVTLDMGLVLMTDRDEI